MLMMDMIKYVKNAVLLRDKKNMKKEKIEKLMTPLHTRYVLLATLKKKYVNLNKH